ncbi:MAG TPA: LPS assembly protein LptD [Rhizomicrobium sp.]|nr:LPS assembly protein LptD [Rhizomicrobium sp.]
MTAALLLAATSVMPLTPLHAAAPVAAAKPAPTKQEKVALLKADQVEYNTNTGVTVATGHVEIDYNQQILLADRVIYDSNADKVTAVGHVILMQPDGTVGFSDRAVLTDQMKDGVLDGFSALIGKTGRLAGTYATRKGGVRTVATRAVYTNCKVCNQPGKRTPLWQVEASRVIYDEPDHRIFYNDAVIDAFGIPVFYTPLFSNSDPTVRRASGILLPELADSSTLGWYTRIPIYISLNDSQDFTIAPMITSKQGDVLETEYRQRWNNGGFWLQPSVAYNPRGGDFDNLPQTYSSFFGAGQLQMDDTWKAAFDAQVTSNETWLELYKISQAQRLQNDIYVEGVSGRSRFEITGYFFQGLLAADDNQEFPVVLPLVDYTYIPEGDLFGGNFRFEFNTASIARQVGEESQRGTAEVTWELPLVTSNGQLLTLVADTRGDIYHIDNPQLGAVPTDSHYISRGLPYAAIDWRWPFISSSPSGNLSYVFEPIAQFIGAPYGGNPVGIPNEDSTDFQFDETDIFSFNRSPGYDLVETGPRMNTGFRTQMIYPSGSVQLLVGQEFRLKPDPIFAADSGFSGTSSDLVGRLTVNFLPHFDFTERVDVNEGSGTLERNEVYVDAYYGRSTLEISYLKVPEEEVTLGLPTREEVNAQALVNVWEDWMVYAAGQRDLQTSTMIADELGFGYDDECIGISISYRRTYTTDRNVPPSTDVLVRFNLKTSDQPETPDHNLLFPTHLYSHIAL